MTPETKDLVDTGSKIVIAIAAVYGAIRAKRNGIALEIVRREVNGQTQQLLKVTGEAEHAKGVKQEKENPS